MRRWLLVAALLSGCELETPREDETAYPSAGLYTPGSRLGASDPTDTPTPGAGLGERCESLDPLPDGGMPTEGELTLEYETRTYEGRYAPKNCTASWIETPDGDYVATIEIGAGLRRPGLVYWQQRACTEKPGPDVVTSATLKDHESVHTAVWRGLDLEGMPVADGDYKLVIEVTESDKEPGEITTFDFQKGPMPYEQELAVPFEAPIERASLTWEPGAGDE